MYLIFTLRRWNSILQIFKESRAFTLILLNRFMRIIRLRVPQFLYELIKFSCHHHLSCHWFFILSLLFFLFSSTNLFNASEDYKIKWIHPSCLSLEGSVCRASTSNLVAPYSPEQLPLLIPLCKRSWWQNAFAVHITGVKGQKCDQAYCYMATHYKK